jgi:predicted RND superfamily exporter protein
MKWDPPKSDSDLIKLVQSGMVGNQKIELDGLIGGTSPDKITQNDDGTNDVTTAKAAMLGYPYALGDYTQEQLFPVEKALEEEAKKFNKESKFVNIFLFTPNGLKESFDGDLNSDLGIVQISVTLVAVYCIIFLGGCSPIHFRSAAAGIALLCVGLSFGSSSGLCYLVGGKSAGIHQLLPFLLIGIGVDDCFVIASNIDQTDPRLPVEKRMMIGLQHAGSSITITSFTNAIAFFLGCTASLEALSSFCFFAGMGILMLYLTSISVFSSFMVWDIRR